MSYRVRFEDGFDFVKGGKLPGLIGGTGNTGGNRPNGSDGWSGRMMWRRGGDAVQYVYHPDQPGIYGEDFRWERRFEPGRWHTVEHRFVMNDPRKHDGILQAWFDGQEALYVDDLRFRDVDSFAIDQFYTSTFFGGGDSTWRRPRMSTSCSMTSSSRPRESTCRQRRSYRFPTCVSGFTLRSTWTCRWRSSISPDAR